DSGVSPKSPSKAVKTSLPVRAVVDGAMPPRLTVAETPRLTVATWSANATSCKGRAGSRYTTCNAQPPKADTPVPTCRSATVYTPGPALATVVVTSAMATYRIGNDGSGETALAVTVTGPAPGAVSWTVPFAVGSGAAWPPAPALSGPPQRSFAVSTW